MIIIISILCAIALPAFLSQTEEKNKDERAKPAEASKSRQYLPER